MKKLTDKIYIAESNSHPGFFAQEYFLLYRWTKFNSIEYIRKDALLEKLNRARELRIKAGAKEQSEGIRVIDALTDLINRI